MLSDRVGDNKTKDWLIKFENPTDVEFNDNLAVKSINKDEKHVVLEDGSQ